MATTELQEIELLGSIRAADRFELADATVFLPMGFVPREHPATVLGEFIVDNSTGARLELRRTEDPQRFELFLLWNGERPELDEELQENIDYALNSEPEDFTEQPVLEPEDRTEALVAVPRSLLLDLEYLAGSKDRGDQAVADRAFALLHPGKTREQFGEEVWKLISEASEEG